MELGRNIELHKNDKNTSRNSIANEIKISKKYIQIKKEHVTLKTFMINLRCAI